MDVLDVEGTFNLRSHADAAGRPWLYRSAALDALTPRGVEQLLAAGVQLVVDLREDGELAAPDAAGHAAGHGIAVRRVPIYRTPDGPPRTGSIEDVYRAVLSDRGPALAEAVAAVATSTGPVLVHCTAGKDRTGLVVALALRAAGLGEEEVVEDYVRSGPEVARHRAGVVATALAALALDEDEERDARRLHLDSPASAIQGALAQVAARGGAARYLLDSGLPAADLQLLRERFRGRP